MVYGGMVFVGTALFPQGSWEQEIGYLLAVSTNLWEQLFPQRLWEHQMEASYWLFHKFVGTDYYL